MTIRDIAKWNITMTHDVVKGYLSDLTDADLLRRAAPGMNHIAWQLGHLIASEQQMMAGIGCSMPALPDGFVEAHTKETASSNDAKKFRTKAEYVELMGKMHAATLAAIDKLTDADMDKPTPDSMQSYAPRVAHLIVLIGSHEMMHSGQFVAVRRLLGKPAMF